MVFADDNLEFFMNAVGNSAMGICIADARLPNFPLIYVNKPFEKLTGYDFEYCRGKNCRFLQGEDNKQESLIAIRQALSNQHSCKVVVRNYKRSGELFWNELTLSPMFDSNNVLTHYLGIQNDVTKSIENRKKLGDLEFKLNRKAEILDSANKEIEALSFSVSHDLRVPISRIITYSKMLSKGMPLGQPREKQYISNIIKGGETIKNMVDAIFSLSNQQGQKLNIQLIDTYSLAVSVIEQACFDDSDREVHFEMGNLPSIYSDAMILRLVFHYIISNAIKYTGKEQQALIQISYEECDYEHVFCIKDNGVGFDMKQYEKLFMAFQRLHSDDEFEGAGFGMANAKRVINRLEGKIWAKSELGKGASFYFSIPKKF